MRNANLADFFCNDAEDGKIIKHAERCERFRHSWQI